MRPNDHRQMRRVLGNSLPSFFYESFLGRSTSSNRAQLQHDRVVLVTLALYLERTRVTASDTVCAVSNLIGQEPQRHFLFTLPIERGQGEGPARQQTVCLRLVVREFWQLTPVGGRKPLKCEQQDDEVVEALDKVDALGLNCPLTIIDPYGDPIICTNV